MSAIAVVVFGTGYVGLVTGTCPEDAGRSPGTEQLSVAGFKVLGIGRTGMA